MLIFPESKQINHVNNTTILKSSPTYPVSTIEPIVTPTLLSIADKELSNIILDKGPKYQTASIELLRVIEEGDLDYASNARESMIFTISDEKDDLKDMNVQNIQMKSKWASYLNDESQFLYQIRKVIKNLRNEKMTDDRASLITATKYLDFAEVNYNSAKSYAMSV